MSVLPMLAFSAASIPSVQISAGVHLPLVSLGTGSGQHGRVANATASWLLEGGTAIDTAYNYNNAQQIAAGISMAGVRRNKIFVITKVPCGTYASVWASAYLCVVRWICMC